jgi:hypothetical protein
MRLALLTILLAGPVAAPEPKPMSPDEVPPSLAPLVARANAAADFLRERLYGRLNEALQESGPASAVDVCRTEAPRLSKEAGDAHHVEIGRTSHKVRNQANAPRAWAAPYVKASGGKKGAEVKPAVLDLGDRIGLLRPIAATPPGRSPRVHLGRGEEALNALRARAAVVTAGRAARRASRTARSPIRRA